MKLLNLLFVFVMYFLHASNSYFLDNQEPDFCDTSLYTLKPSPVGSCTFDGRQNTACGYSAATGRYDLKWAVGNPPRDVYRSVFRSGHNGTAYVVLNIKEHTFGNNSAWLATPEILAGPFCIRFWYNMPRSTSNLIVEIRHKKEITKVLNLTGDHGPEWKQHSISDNVNETYQVYFISSKKDGNSYLGLDDITFYKPEKRNCSNNNGECSQLCVTEEGHRCRCRTGYALQGDGQTCLATICRPPPVIQNGNRFTTGPLINDTASFSCWPGYRLDRSNARITCVLGGLWVGVIPKCLDIDECMSNPCHNHGSCLDKVNSYQCSCADGYTGSNCEIDIDECDYYPCQNRGTCYDQVNGYQCSCVSGYTGNNCETDINECDSNPCKNHGSCQDQVNGYHCTCVSGYTGSNCETDINDCQPNPCQHQGTCQDQVNGYHCSCVAGYTGQSCETDIDYCQPNPCQHQGTCYDQVNGYHCTCVSGYTGSNCETDINECDSNPCQHQGTCQDQVNGYHCTCVSGYTGRYCETDIDDCQPNPCQHQGTCYDQVNGYQCSCVSGYTGQNCETVCLCFFPDINECKFNPCQNNGTFTDNVNSYQCSCVGGYAGSDCGTDIDECESNSCQNNGTCTDSVNSYQCLCVNGYAGSDCGTDINECASNPCQHQGTCQDQVNGYQCTCVIGYTGSNCETGILYENYLQVKCGESNWHIKVQLNELRRLFPDFNLRDVYLGRDGCLGYESLGNLVFDIDYNSCSTTKSVSNENISYSNTLVYAFPDPIHRFIVREYRFKVKVQCEMSREESEHNSIHHNHGESKNHTSAGVGHFAIHIRFFSDALYQHELQGYPPSYMIGDNVYVKVDTALHDSDIKMRVTECFTKPTEKSSNSYIYYLINKGCPEDSQTVITSQSTHETRFHFQDFEYAGFPNSMFVNCNATFCKVADYSSKCEPQCHNHIKRRLLKRQVSEDDNEVVSFASDGATINSLGHKEQTAAFTSTKNGAGVLKVFKLNYVLVSCVTLLCRKIVFR